MEIYYFRAGTWPGSSRSSPQSSKWSSLTWSPSLGHTGIQAAKCYMPGFYIPWRIHPLVFCPWSVHPCNLACEDVSPSDFAILNYRSHLQWTIHSHFAMTIWPPEKLSSDNFIGKYIPICYFSTRMNNNMKMYHNFVLIFAKFFVFFFEGL